MAASREEYMKLALELAKKGLGRTSPNPAVGAVVVKDGEVVGKGFHRRAGEDHAEVVALKEAGEKAEGAELYVTLEPCSHYGKTPPCTQAIIASGIKKVYAAVLDPNPLVSGKGIKRLRECGIEVEVGLLHEEAWEINEAFFHYITKGRPFVALKMAMTLDGKIATRSRDSKWVTGEKAREFVHRLRNTYDAVLVGIGTVLADDPMLNVRLEEKDVRDPVRLIVDGFLEIPEESRIVKTAQKQKTIIYTSRKAQREKVQTLEGLGVEVVEVGEEADSLPLEAVLLDLAQRGIMSVLVEGGSRINGYLWDRRLVDKVYWFIAPRICGGEKALSPIGGWGVERMEDAVYLQKTRVTRRGEDILIVGYPGFTQVRREEECLQE